VVLERRFDVAAEVLWRLWTDPDHFARWYGPDRSTVPVVRMDVRVGGTRQVAMEMNTPNGPMRMWFTGEFREVTPHERLVYTESISDENGNVLTAEQAGMPRGHPTVTEVRVDLREQDGATTMIVTHAGIPADSPGAAGWTAALERLAAHVRAVAASQR
jgi:uncharacterized protein YndB with AHSA1/START domain